MRDACEVIDVALRPMLARWHPALEDWEAGRPERLSRSEHERAWDQASDLRAALETTRDLLTQYARLMASACSVPDLLEEVVVPQQSGTGG